jgi:hypothetical protein
MRTRRDRWRSACKASVMKMKRLLPLVALPFAFACGVPETASIDLSSHGVDTWRGLSLSPEGDRLHLVAEGRGLFELERNGTLIAERRVGEAGLIDAAYRDVAALDAAYVLLADDQGWLYDPQAESESVHFCVLPGEIIGPVTKQKNDAVSVDGDVIYATPRFYELDDNGNETLTSSELRTYRLSDGEPTGVAPLEHNLELNGVAVRGELILGVSGDRVYSLARDGRVIGETQVSGLANAAGIAVDDENAFILDASNERIAIVPLDALR